MSAAGLVERPALRARAGDLLALAKPRVTLLVVLTTAVGFHVAARGAIDAVVFLLTLLGTGLVSGGTLALNQLLERDLDALMERTRRRPLPGGRLEPVAALAFGVALVVLGLALLALAVHPLAGAVTAATVVLYLFAYTPLKRRSALCTVVGAFPGALPPVTGWAAARGSLDEGALALFGILFFWQLPHSLAIARLYRDDYARAGIRLLPVVDPDGGSTGRQVVLHSLALVAAGTVPALVGIAGALHLAVAVAAGLVLVALSAALARTDSVASARRLFLASLLYVPAVFGLLLLGRPE